MKVNSYFFYIGKRLSHTHSKKSVGLYNSLSNNVFNGFNNFNYPSCDDCIYFIPSDSEQHKCKRFMKPIGFTGDNINYVSVDTSRKHFELCGPEAKCKIVRK